MIRAAGIEEQDAPRKFVRVKKNVSIHVGDKWASLEPYDGYKLSFAIDFGHPAIDETAQFVEVDFNKENYIESVSHARTFGFVNDLEMLWGMGLAQGGTLDNAIEMCIRDSAKGAVFIGRDAPLIEKEVDYPGLLKAHAKTMAEACLLYTSDLCGGLFPHAGCRDSGD